jgi:antitoxin MazE
METVVKKWGNSLGIRIPNNIAKGLKLKDGSSVEIEDNNGQIIISPKKYNLSEMLDKIEKENIHPEYNTGKIKGKEQW